MGMCEEHISFFDAKIKDRFVQNEIRGSKNGGNV